MLTLLIRWWYKITNRSPDQMEMVSYWKTKKGIDAKVTRAKDGSTQMFMSGEKYPLKTFPRGYLLFGPLSKLKHEIKNQIFNESWARLEAGESHSSIISNIKKKLSHEIVSFAAPMQYDMLPPGRLNPVVREIHRAWTKVSPHTAAIRDYLCLILQEDDAYCFRVQWLAEWFGWFMKRNPVKSFEYALSMLEHGEVVSDMKERERLLKRILMLVLEDPSIRAQFIALFREINWKKVKLTKGDKYHFRAKYFKVDLKYLEY